MLDVFQIQYHYADLQVFVLMATAFHQHANHAPEEPNALLAQHALEDSNVKIANVSEIVISQAVFLEECVFSEVNAKISKMASKNVICDPKLFICYF